MLPLQQLGHDSLSLAVFVCWHNLQILSAELQILCHGECGGFVDDTVSDFRGSPLASELLMALTLVASHAEMQLLARLFPNSSLAGKGWVSGIPA